MKIIQKINNNIEVVKTELNHLGLVFFITILSIIVNITGVDLGSDIIQSLPFTIIIIFGILIIIGIIIEIYIKLKNIC